MQFSDLDTPFLREVSYSSAINELNSKLHQQTLPAAQSAGAIEYTNCISAER